MSFFITNKITHPSSKKKQKKLKNKKANKKQSIDIQSQVSNKMRTIS